ncbi:MAG: cell wall surface anchor family protein [Acidimicrobiaceae bacterium]|nr:MAG: cell wall surface anchor family protein [Acidimicrobiaceae bacterium]
MLAAIASATTSRSGACSPTKCADFPPSSVITGTRLVAADAVSTCRPVASEPVRFTKSMPSCATSAVPTTSPRPATTFKTPAGRPASIANSASNIALAEEVSLGLSTTQFPMANTGTTLVNATKNGKFHGEMTATTPRGTRHAGGTASADTSGTIPSRSRAICAAAGTSAMVMPRGMPTSSVSSSASRSVCRSTRSARRASASTRATGSFHTPRASARLAAPTARSTSSGEPAGRVHSKSPLAGLIDPSSALSADSTCTPSTNDRKSGRGNVPLADVAVVIERSPVGSSLRWCAIA